MDFHLFLYIDHLFLSNIDCLSKMGQFPTKLLRKVGIYRGLTGCQKLRGVSAKVTRPVTGRVLSKVVLCPLRAAEKWANSGAPGGQADGEWKDSRPANPQKGWRRWAGSPQVWPPLPTVLAPGLDNHLVAAHSVVSGSGEKGSSLTVSVDKNTVPAARWPCQH